uniref:Immunoglobulin domain-containing protein n=1 Tax=Pelusios castaneus TaxID=367368 RepID=A0A8C8SQR0_9SAUR
KLVRKRGMVAQNHEPSILPVHGVITLGQAVTIRCQCRCRGRRLLLYKDGIRVRELDADEDRSKFPITNVRREDGGVYMCRSRSRLEPPDWSDPSDSMWIIVVGERALALGQGFFFTVCAAPSPSNSQPVPLDSTPLPQPGIEARRDIPLDLSSLLYPLAQHSCKALSQADMPWEAVRPSG